MEWHRPDGVGDFPSRVKTARIAPYAAWMTCGTVALLFVHLSSEVAEGETQDLDTRVFHWAQSVRMSRPWLEEALRDFSGLGSTVLIVLLALVSCGYLLLSGRRILAAIVASATLSGSIAVEALKHLFARPRPDASVSQYFVAGPSFPSGHASMSAVLFILLGVLSASALLSRAERAYALGVAAFLTFAVGVSRIASGVHWTTDVVGGWCFGVAWAALWLCIAQHLLGRPRRGLLDALPTAGDRIE